MRLGQIAVGALGQGVTALILVPQLISGARVSPHVRSFWKVAKVHGCPMYSVAIQIVEPTGRRRRSHPSAAGARWPRR